MAAKRDYYEILGVSKNASVDEIKRAYRTLALSHHPDRVSADKKKEAEEKFKEISEAYAVLSDSQKRSLYDQYGHAGVEGAFKQGGFSWQDFHHFDDLRDIFGGADVSDLLRGFGFGGDIFGGSYTTTRRGGPRRGADLEYQLTIDFNTAVFGGERTIAIPRYETCPDCGGTGAKAGTRQERCPDCGGRHEIFGSGGGQERAAQLNVRFLGEVPLNIQLRIRGDEGTLGSSFEDEASKPHLEALCHNLVESLVTRRRKEPPMPSLPVLD